MENTILGKDDLVYPILMIGEGYYLIFDNALELIACSCDSLEGKVFQEASYIDSSGTIFNVSSVSMVGYVPPF